MKIKCTFHIAIAFILIQLTDEFSIAFAYGICEKNPYVRILYVTFAILSLLTMIYLYTKYIIRIQMQDLFLGMPLPKKKWCITAVLMPVLICLFYIFFTKGTFEKGNLTYKEIIDVVTISILSSGIKAAVTEEIVFRGMILRLLQNTFGKICAVFVSSFLFAVYHFDGIDTSDIKKVIMMIISVMQYLWKLRCIHNHNGWYFHGSLHQHRSQHHIFHFLPFWTRSAGFQKHLAPRLPEYLLPLHYDVSVHPLHRLPV